MNRQKLIADFRRTEVREGVPASRVQQELFEALAVGDEEYAYDAAKMLAHFARPLLRRAAQRESRRPSRIPIARFREIAQEVSR